MGSANKKKSLKNLQKRRAFKNTEGKKKKRKNKNVPATTIKGLSTYGGQAPMPVHKFLRFRYTQTMRPMSVGASGVLGTQQQWNLNSLFDVDATGGGHQPSGFDEMSAFYYRYKVNACKIVVRATDPTIDGMRMIYRIINPSQVGGSLTGANIDVISEQQQAGFIDVNNSGSQKFTKTFYVPIWKASGLTKLQFDADPDNYTAPVTGDPGSLLRMQFALADLNQGSSGAMTVTFDITYYCLMYQRKILPQS